MTQDKIRFYQEVLELEPGSRLFFPLAKLYYENNDILNARQTLKNGLEKHPEHFEARLLLASILIKEGNNDQAAKIYQDIFSILIDNNDFWETLSNNLASQGNNDLSLAAAFFARAALDNSLSWTDILKAGLDNLKGTSDKNITQAEPQPLEEVQEESDIPQEETHEVVSETSASQEDEINAVVQDDLDDSLMLKEPEPEDNVHETRNLEGSQEVEENSADSEKNIEEINSTRESPEDLTGHEHLNEKQDIFDDPEELADFDIDNDARTRSMADILFGQEEYAKALDIYEELWRNTLPGDERKELEELIEKTKQAENPVNNEPQNTQEAADSQETQPKQQKDEAISFLMTLADRLEAKATESENNQAAEPA
ncbi:MAG: tetratricopeptide repeat protein [Desulfonatronovibrio sp.]